MTFTLIAGGLSTSVDKRHFAKLREDWLHWRIDADDLEEVVLADCERAKKLMSVVDALMDAKARLYAISPSTAAQVFQDGV